MLGPLLGVGRDGVGMEMWRGHFKSEASPPLWRPTVVPLGERGPPC